MGRSSDRYLAIVVVLVVVQAAGFIAWKVWSGDDPKPAAVAATGSAPAPGGSALGADDGSAPAPEPVPAVPDKVPANVSTPDAAPAPVVVDEADATDEADAPADATLDRKERARRKVEEREKARRAAELARQEKEERERRAAAEKAAADRARREAEENRRAEAAKAEKERQALAAEAAAARAAAEKARAEAEAAKREAERIAAAAKPTGSNKVLVLVLGPGASSSRSDIKSVYTGATSVWPNGTTARPYNRPASSGAGRLFYGRVLGMSAADVRDKWTSLQLSGGGIAPSTVSSASAIIQKVAGTRGAIGYVLESELPADTSGLRLVRLE